MKTINGLNLKKYRAYLLHPIQITPVEIERDIFKTDNGIAIFGEKKQGFKEVRLNIEFQGNRKTIETNKSRLLTDLELCRLNVGDGRVYEGQFLFDEIIDTYLGYEVISVIGKCEAYKVGSYKFEIDKKKRIVLNEVLECPVILKLTGTGSNITISGLTKIPIKIKRLNGEISINGTNGLINGDINNIDFYEFPKLKNDTTIEVTGSGTFKTEIEYRVKVM